MRPIRERRKTGGAVAAACRSQGIAVVPLAVLTLGAWHEDAVSHIRKLGRAVARRSGAPDSVTISHLFQRLGASLQRSNAMMILSRQTSFPPLEIDGQ